jgi:hypothetical protein
MPGQFASFALLAAPSPLPASVANRPWRAIRTAVVVLFACAFLALFVAAVIYCFATGQVGSPM